jgi:hypothetical protein
MATRWNFCALAQFCYQHLCHLGTFEPGVFRMSERLIRTLGDTTAIYYCLHGPRRVKLTAICDLRGGYARFYGCDGQWIEQAPLPPGAQLCEQRQAA